MQKPLIRRAWNARKAQFVWTAVHREIGNWGTSLKNQERHNNWAAYVWCNNRNAFEEAKRQVQTQSGESNA